MIEINKKTECCGCEACANVCPKNCIKMVYDEEGYRYAKVDKENCINCGLCEKVCPIKNEPKKTYLDDLKYYAGYNNDDAALAKSSSGGIFWLLADFIFKKNGIVYGVVQDSTFDVRFERTTSHEQAEKLRGSKYLQANVNDTYRLVKNDLDENKEVLFSGTPCQVAGLYNYLKKQYDNLYTCDVVCHGVPSDKVYKKFISYIEETNKKKVKNIKWRDKTNGWGPNKIVIYFTDGSSIITTSRENMFQTGFLDNLYLRPSCYECKYARLPRIGDISLADFWGYDGELVEKNNNKGLSAIIVSSEKGQVLFNSIEKSITYHPVSKEYLIKRSRHSYIHPEENENREKFFSEIDSESFINLAKKYNLKRNKYKVFLSKVKRRIKKVIKK